MTPGILFEQLSRYYHSWKWEIQDELKTWTRHEVMVSPEFEVPMEMFNGEVEI